LLNLATCEAEQGHLATAWLLWKEAADALPAEDDRGPFVQAHIQALDARLPRVVYQLKNPPDNITLDDTGVSLSRASLGASLPVDPGQHRVSVRAPDRTTWSASYYIAESEHKTVELGIGARQTVEPEESSSRTAGYWLLGTGAAGFLTAGVTGALALDARKQYADHCPDANCDAQGDAAAKRGKTLVTVNLVAWIAALASTATGVGLLLTDSHETPIESTAWRLVPVAAGMGFQKAF
jgi:hypothetical protein